MGELTRFPVLDAIQEIRTVIQNDDYLGGLFSFTNAVTNSTEYRIYSEPVDNKAIKGQSCSAWFQGEARYVESSRKQIPRFYIDIAAQNLDLTTAVNNSWKYMRCVIETLNLNANLDKSCEDHWAGDIYPVEERKTQLWTYILRCDYYIAPHKPTLYT